MENSLNNQASEIGKYFPYSYMHNCKEELDAGHLRVLGINPLGQRHRLPSSTVTGAPK